MRKSCLIIIVMLCVLCKLTQAVSSWGEECTYTAECNDHRLICAPDNNNVTRCECDRFHKWAGNATGCVALYDAKTMIKMVLSSNRLEENLVITQDRIYTAQLYAGLFVMVVALVCPLIVSFYCLYFKNRDQRFKEELFEIQSRVDTIKKRKNTSARV